MWDTYQSPLQACIQEAWAAYRAGSLPIGAVVVNGASEYMRRQRVQAIPPEDAYLEAALVALQVEWHLAAEGAAAEAALALLATDL